MIKPSIGLVPTMGNLHKGHISLLERSKKENDLTILSIFINPTQFDHATDFKEYPRTLEQDKKIAESLGVDQIFIPDYETLYPDNYAYKITESEWSSVLEGKHRPGHFDGMLTVVLKLFLQLNPTRAYFGEKDYQQLQLIKGLVNAFLLPIDIIGCPTIRNENGLPLSSRLNRLTAEQYQQAQLFPRIFHADLDCTEIKKQLNTHGFMVDYIEDYKGRRYAAVKLGNIRLIDNISQTEKNTCHIK